MSTTLFSHDTTIAALATPPGRGAIAVIRLSGNDAITIANSVFSGADLPQQASHTIHFGTIRDAANNVVDEVLISLFKAPRSYTKENVVEISCHGSEFIVHRILQLLIDKGARPAQAGEFTKRAFLNGRFDLAQAEAVADLIASDSEAAHRIAMQQMRGGFSDQIKRLRDQLVHFAALIELELDFGEEDVEFAKRDDLLRLVDEIERVVTALMDSFHLGNALKNGIPTVIAGKPNAGKSTLLNVLFNEEKAIVSDIPGTTRDVIEDELLINGVRFRLTDTAGLRETQDVVEALGVTKTRQKLQNASLILYLIDATSATPESVADELAPIRTLQIPLLAIASKIDRIPADAALHAWLQSQDILPISATQQTNISRLKEQMLTAVHANRIQTGDTLVSNVRHYESLRRTHDALLPVQTGITSGISGDLLALDIRTALHYLGEITGEITTDDLLATIFSKFCIGK